MGRLLVTFATLLVLLLAGAFVAPAFTDWNAYRPDIQEAASALLGRKISIAGDIDIALLPEPHLHAKRVVAEGGSTEAAQMTADAVDLTLSLQALLSGRVEASKLKLVKPFVILDLSKPLQRPSELAKAGLAPPSSAAAVTSLEIEGGRISVYPDAGQPEALILTDVDGALAAPQQGNAYRFTGRLSQKNRRYDVKFSASAQSGGVKLAGSAAELQSKAGIQAEGTLNTADAPFFTGTLAAIAPQAAAGTPFEIQAKATARLDRTGLSLSDLLLTLDQGSRPQILAGSANLTFAPQKADIALEAQSLDADALLPGSTDPATGAGASWDGFRSAAGDLLWLYPDFGLHLSLNASQVQLRGDLIEGVKAEGTRMAEKWLFEDAQAKLPGETAVELTGTLRRTAGKPELLARAGLEGKNLSRLIRFLAPTAANARSGPPQAFKAGALLTLSDEVTAFSGVKGDIGGTPFTASLRLDKTPERKLKLSLAGESFDLTSIEGAHSREDALSGESLKAAWRNVLTKLAPVLGNDPTAYDMADVDISAASLRTSIIQAKNAAVQFKFDRGTLTVTKLSAETASGLSLHGEGTVPMRGSEQGRFEGHLDAPSPKAVLELAALAGYDGGSMIGRRAEALAPASLSINSSTAGPSEGATALVSGTVGAARLDGRVQIKGDLAEWRAGHFSGQIALSAADGDKLAAFLSPEAGLAAGGPVSPGTITIRANGIPADRLDTAVTVKTPSLQAQIDGTAKLGSAFSFSGMGQASSQKPEQFLPPALLALLGGEPQTTLKVASALALGPGKIDASKLRAESARNIVSGHVAIGGTGRATEIDADLKAGQLSLPKILGYVLAPASLDRSGAALPEALSSLSSGIWSDQPFDLKTLQDTTAKISLAAKTLSLGDTLALSDAQGTATLEDGRLDIKKLTGKAFGGDLAASLSLDGRASIAAASGQVSLSRADIGALAAGGSPPIATGKASLSLQVSGQGLSPHGLISVLQGRGVLALTDGQLPKLSPLRVQKSGDELASALQPLPEDTIKKKVFDALQSADFKYRHLKIPVRIRNGMLEIPRASFRNKDGTVRMEAYLDLSTMQADTTWQAGVSSDRHAKWPPVKVQLAGPLQELGAKPRVLWAEDFARTLVVRKMEGDMTRLENLGKPPASPSWNTKQEPVQPLPARRKQQGSPSPAQAGAAAGRPTNFEKRMYDALSKGPQQPSPQAQQQ